MIDQIVDLIVREALSRGGRFTSKIAEVNLEVMLKMMDIIADYQKEREMNDRAKPPQSIVHINLNEMPSVGCPNCSCEIFTTNYAMYKKLSAIQVGKAQIVRVILERCEECGALCQVVNDGLKLVEMAPLGKEDTDREA